MPFPGMDPYLEHPALWPDVHNSLIAALRDDLAPRLRPRYYVSIEERAYLVDHASLALVARPDVAVVGTGQAVAPRPASPQLAAWEPGAVTVTLPMPEELRETWIEVRAAGSHAVVTIVEMLSPTNKLPGEGREQYLRKRAAVLASTAHFVEIDLLRDGLPMPASPSAGGGGYRILVSRARRRPLADLFVFSVQDAIPVFRLPLQPDDDEPAVDLGSLLIALYDRAGYDLRADYAHAPMPPLGATDEAWADAILRQAGLRRPVAP